MFEINPFRFGRGNERSLSPPSSSSDDDAAAEDDKDDEDGPTAMRARCSGQIVPAPRPAMMEEGNYVIYYLCHAMNYISCLSLPTMYCILDVGDYL
jgi:hypothetical protein